VQFDAIDVAKQPGQVAANILKKRLPHSPKSSVVSAITISLLGCLGSNSNEDS